MNSFTRDCRSAGQTPAEAYFAHLIEAEKNGSCKPGSYGVYLEIARLAAGKADFCELNFRQTADFILGRADCLDFMLPGVIYLMTRYGSDGRVPAAVKKEARELILGAKYWIDEGGPEKSPCYFTENHQMLFHACEYAAGQLYPDEVFTNNGMTGRMRMEHARPMIEDWLEWRFRFGFSEWLSNTYYHEDLLSVSLIALLADDARLREKARMIVDLLLFDIGMNSFHGVFGSSHGRCYCNNLTDDRDGCATVRVVFLENGCQEPVLSPAAVIMAAENFRPAPALVAVANSDGELEHRQRMSLKPEQAAAFGYDPAKPENLFLFWGMQAFSHRLAIDNTLAIKSVPNYYLKERAKAYKENFELCDRAGVHTDDDCDYTSMPQADVYTYKTDDYMMSAAQDFKKGKFGFQQHIWQLSLGGKAVIFTTHPGSGDYAGRPNRWAGNRILPKALALRNVTVCMYNTDVRLCPDFVHYTHAYFPQEFMDETAESGGWYFARRGESYAALTVLTRNAFWADPDKAYYPFMNITDADAAIKPYELCANGRSNVWICEAGCRRDNGSFADFIASFAASEPTGDVFSFSYNSPSLGAVSSGWTLPLTVAGNAVSTSDYPRYDCRFCRAPAGCRSLEINCAGHRLSLDFDAAKRETD